MAKLWDREGKNRRSSQFADPRQINFKIKLVVKPVCESVQS